MALLFAFIPYLYCCFYAFPFADDFCFGWTASENISFIQKFLNQYLGWNGRYTADVLANVHPLAMAGIAAYQRCLLAGLLITPVVLYVFTDSLLPTLGASHKVIGALLATLLYLNLMPDITEGMYWYIGLVNYQVGALCVLLQVAMLVKSFEQSQRAKFMLRVLSGGLLVAGVGFNEIAAAYIPVGYFIGFIVLPKHKQLMAVYLAVALVASGFVFLAPGNFVRAQLFSEKYRLFYSAGMGVLQTGRFILTWVVSVPFVVFSLLLAAYSNKLKQALGINKNCLWLGAGILLLIFGGSFLPYFATGLLGQHRTINYVLFFSLLLYVPFAISVSNKFRFYEKLARLQQTRVVYALLMAGIVSLMLSGNSLRILNDVRGNNFVQYAQAFKLREQQIIAQPDKPITQIKTIPGAFRIADVKGDTAYWVDKCMRQYYAQTAADHK